MKGTYRVALMLSMAAFSAASVEAAELNGPNDDATYEVRVVNNFVSSVRVYAQDSEGRLHSLGQVARGQVQSLEVSAEIAERGEVRIKIYPYEPTWSLLSHASAIRTEDLDLQTGVDVTIWVEPDLAASTVEIRS